MTDDQQSTGQDPAHAFLRGGGELGRRIRAFDWSRTSLGPLDAWPTCLRNTMALVLRSQVPIVTLWNEDGVMLYNDAYAVFAGGRDSTLLGSKVREGWPEVAGFNDHVMKTCLAGGTLAFKDQELTLYRSGQAEQVWMNLDYSPILDDAGTPVAVIAIVIETTAKVRAEAASKASAAALERLNGTLEEQVAQRTAERDRMWMLSTDIMLVADFEGRIAAINPAWTTLLGWSQAELLGTVFLDLVHPDDVATTEAELGGLASGQVTFRFENRYRDKFGAWRVISWTAVPDSRFLHAVGRDVTLEREAGKALRESEAALQQAQKMEAIGQLTGGVAHDFNNILQVISGNLQLLAREHAESDRIARRVGQAMGSVQRGAKLASQLLSFSRRQPLEPKVINLGRLVAGMEEMLRRTLGETVEIETVSSAGLWNAFADPAQLENALLNLAINARDAMQDNGRLTIETGNAFLDDDYVRAHPDLARGQYVMLAVSDTGIGMSPEVLEKAFEPFFSTKPEGKGTGLGLSMVYGYVKQSGGHVKLYSEPGHGTTVKIYLPRSHAELRSDSPQHARLSAGGNETILVAEDDEGVRSTVVDLLSALGYRVLAAKDADSALKIIETGVAIDLLFTDVVMPGLLKSPDLARLARQLRPGMAVLFTSGYTENAIVHGGRLDPGVALLGKPYTHDALARKIRQSLDERR